ncbi:LacI family DNA-binding transcriptional regulator [Aquincola sp. MAHUQ-54]|uniref:LacI family DNA-binding transcriptional regulator n=1 Tax=Aquincola agrisoli TaxID=3119538 RepID=A0AAW9QDH9_9BURK
MTSRRKPEEAPPPAAPAPAPRRRSNSVTVNDVARVAGVSAMTVSRAVNVPERLPPATLARVQAAIAQTGYVPNLLAGGLRSNRSRLVAALVPTLDSPVFAELVQGLTAALHARGYQLMLGQTGYTESHEDELLRAVIGRRPDGILLTGVRHSPQARQRLAAAGIPVVETWDLTDQPIDMLVGFSHPAVGEAVCRYLHGRGRRRLAVIGGNDERSRRRSDAFCATARALGLAPPVVQEVPAPTTLGSGRAALLALRRADAAVDGIFCSSDLLALGVLTEAMVQGVRIPEQLAVVGFGDLAFARDLHPALTTVRIDGTRIGEEAARCLVDRAEGRTAPADGAPVVDTGFSIVERASA